MRCSFVKKNCAVHSTIFYYLRTPSISITNIPVAMENEAVAMVTYSVTMTLAIPT